MYKFTNTQLYMISDKTNIHQSLRKIKKKCWLNKKQQTNPQLYAVTNNNY